MTAPGGRRQKKFPRFLWESRGTFDVAPLRAGYIRAGGQQQVLLQQSQLLLLLQQQPQLLLLQLLLQQYPVLQLPQEPEPQPQNRMRMRIIIHQLLQLP